MGDPVIQVSGLTKRFGATTAVDGLSFAVARGEILGLLGLLRLASQYRVAARFPSIPSVTTQRDVMTVAHTRS